MEWSAHNLLEYINQIKDARFVKDGIKFNRAEFAQMNVKMEWPNNPGTCVIVSVEL